MSTDRLTWEQVLAWRMRRHHLVERASPDDLLSVVSDICGLHAQLMSSAELSLWARIDGFAPEAVNEALWRDRSLVKLWAMRGTLHLLPSAELSVWVAALSTITNRGMTGHPEIDRLIAAVDRAIEGRVLTREELALEVLRISGDEELAEFVRFSWGSYLKPGSFRGLLCFAENDGSLIRFTSPASWIPGGLERLDPAESLKEVTRRFMRTYAPITAAELALWWGGFGPARGRKMLAALGAEVVEIEVDGERVWVLVEDLPAMAATEPQHTARLLPAFDPWVAAASREGAAVIDPEYRARVYRPQGWLSPVLLVDGRMVGTWKQTRMGKRFMVEIEPFKRLPRHTRGLLEAEVERLHAFLGNELDLTVAWEG